ncbi:MAG: hypothetical protein ACT6QS_09025 [Flavobacteriales bacterium]
MLIFIKKITAILIIALWGYQHRSAPAQPRQQIISAGIYEFRLPDGLSHSRARGSDGQAGCLYNDSLVIYYGCGPYVSDLPETPSEFFASNEWYGNALNHIISKGLFSGGPRPDIQLLDYYPVYNDCRRPQYNAVCRYNETVFEVPVQLPEHMRDYSFRADTMYRQYRKLVFPKKGTEGRCGVWIDPQDSLLSETYGPLTFIAPDGRISQRKVLLQLMGSVRIKSVYL